MLDQPAGIITLYNISRSIEVVGKSVS